MSALVRPAPVLRPMCVEDVERVMRIEEEIYAFPWTRGNFLDSIRARYHCYLYEVPSALVGYGVMMVAVQEAHLLNLSIASSWQRRGHGRELLAHFIRIAREQGAHTMVLEVRPSNDAASHLYRRAGFRVVGVRPNYYPAEGGREDAILMERPL
ncbi:ribosomal protein S18-alanine N-acetyltransferase [Pelomicrobium sp.]|jgi:ribosomal-protein-alanine N-acetyltransferase|uniref:ribosomal protein S18-alanine N-acetyltransferase n=1 Tax=Pelomicrobium sp. TaxID=2815319 RepID=UPI002FDCDBD5